MIPRPARRLLHDYGHGSAGVTLAFGCADQILRLATRRWDADESSLARGP